MNIEHAASVAWEFRSIMVFLILLAVLVWGNARWLRQPEEDDDGEL